MRKLVTAAITAAFVAVCLVGGGAGAATAAPIPQVTFTGYNFGGAVGDHSFCRGAMNVSVDTVPRKRGVLRVTARSFGFSGQGATWKRNPKCKLLLWNVYTSTRGLNKEKWVTVSFGPRPGEKRTWEIPSGSGPVSLGIARSRPITRFVCPPVTDRPSTWLFLKVILPVDLSARERKAVQR